MQNNYNYTSDTDEQLIDRIYKTRDWFKNNGEYKNGYVNPQYNRSNYGRGMTAFCNMMEEKRKRGLEVRLIDWGDLEGSSH